MLPGIEQAIPKHTSMSERERERHAAVRTLYSSLERIREPRQRVRRPSLAKLSRCSMVKATLGSLGVSRSMITLSCKSGSTPCHDPCCSPPRETYGALAEELYFVVGCAHDHAHAFPITAKLEDIQDLVRFFLATLKTPTQQSLCRSEFTHEVDHHTVRRTSIEYHAHLFHC